VPTRSYRPGERALISDGSQVLAHHAHDIATEQLIPRIAERNKKAVETVPLYVALFRALNVARRCSCFDIETSPDRHCSACFGVGWVGGYEKYGTTVEVIDVTRGSLRLSNIMPDWDKRRKPIPFKLINGARKGSLEARIRLTSNIGVVDALAAGFDMPEGTTLRAFVRGPSDLSYVGLTQDNLAQRLFNPWVDIRVELERQSPAQESPLLKTVYLRYQNFEDNLIVVNIPRTAKSIALQELGVFDDYSTINCWTDNKIKSITTEDFFISVEGDTRWKIVSTKDFAPHGQLTSWDLEVRLVQHHESYINVPA